MNENANTISAHKGSGFDPTKYLRKTISETGEPVLRLPLAYQKFWFRQSCPSGRMLLKPLRLTDQLAIFEAQVYLHRDDQAPAGSFTADKTAEETSGYIRAAQDEALSEALDNAGFGYQAQDAAQTAKSDGHGASAAPVRTDGEMRGRPAQKAPASPAPADTQMVHRVSETPVAVEPAQESAPQPATPSTTVETVAPPATVEDNAGQPAPARDAPSATQSSVQQDRPAPVAEHEPAQAEPKEAPMEKKREKPAAPDGQQPSLAAVLNFPEQAAKAAETQELPAPVSTASGQAEPAPQAEPGYTEDMPVEQICQLMTLEEARKVVVTKGTCNGWTMAQVAEKRPSSLRFYISGFGHVNNIQLAAATLLQQELDLKKAG